MRWRTLRSITYFVAKVALWAAEIALVAVGVTVKADPNHLAGIWAVFKPNLAWSQDHAWILLPVFAIVIASAKGLMNLAGPPWVWETIHHFLSTFQEYAFDNAPGDMLHHNRVTLFRHVRFRLCFRKWPTSGWLVPCERSQYTSQRSKVAFLAPDDADKAEGVAGVTWAQKGILPVTNLPDLAQNPTEEQIADYARRTFVKEKWVRDRLKKGKQLAVSFVGIPVEVKGKRWGVIVLDSRTEVKSGQTIQKLYALIGKFSSKILEKV